MDLLIYWFVGATLTGWGIYDLVDYRKNGTAVKLRHGAISSILGLLLLISVYLNIWLA